MDTVRDCDTVRDTHWGTSRPSLPKREEWSSMMCISWGAAHPTMEMGLGNDRSRGRSLTHWMCRWGLMCSCHGPWQEPSRADPNAFQIKHSSNEPICHTVEHHWMSLLIHNQNLFIHPSLRMQPGRLNQQSLGWKISDYKIIWPHHKLAPDHCHWDCSSYNSRNHNDSKNKWAISNLDVDIEIYNG